LYPWADTLTQIHDGFFWTEKEVNLVDDIHHWKDGKMLLKEKALVTKILQLFTQSDVAVGSNYHNYLIPRIKNNEVRNMLACFAAREVIHQRGYALLNDSLGLPESEYSTFQSIPQMYDKMLFLTHSNVQTDRGFALALAKNIIGEGIALFGSFAVLLNFHRQGKMLGMGKVVEWSIRDELVHVDGIIQLFNVWMKEHPELDKEEIMAEVESLFRQGVTLEHKFIDLIFADGGIEGLSANETKDYMCFLANERARKIGIPKLYEIEDNPLEWIDWIVYGVDHSNFIESIVTDYEIAGMKGSWNDVYRDFRKSLEVPQPCQVKSEKEEAK
jgi:ribonucleoside-diphosphate reductase beta chain